MRAPLPYGLFVTGGQATESDLLEADALAREVTNFRLAGDLVAHRMRRELSGGGTVEVEYAGGAFRVYIDKTGADLSLADIPQQLSVPMLFSGVITKAVVPHGAGVEMELSKGTLRRLAGYGRDDVGGVSEIGSKQRLLRFAIPYSARHNEFNLENPGPNLRSQYEQLRPTWFSGAMATVVQIVGGYGRQNFTELPASKVERARMLLPASVAAAAAAELGDVALPGYTGSSPASGEIQFDYKYVESDAVSFGADGKPWLIRVSGRGVYAMPLPMVPVTTTAAFRQYVEDVGDEELLWIIDKFGGMPSGEGFPVGQEAFQAWRRAGVISKVCDTADFYTHIPYSSACGWSFNSRGTEGFNTCYDYDTDGVQLGFAYKMKLGMGAMPDWGRKKKQAGTGDSVRDRAINGYLGALNRALGNSTVAAAVRYKLRRVDVRDILDRAMAAVRSDMSHEVEYWSALELDPIATHTGSVVRTAVGNLWAPGPPRSHPQIKFAEPLMQGCVSHDFSPSIKGAVPPGMIVRCDTVMFGYYVGDQLKVVKYFRDQREYHRDVDSDFEECMTVGSWTQTVTEGSTSLMGHFYTSDFDERDAAADTTEVTKVVGTDLGYDSKPYFSFDEFFHRPGSLWRNRYFMRKTEVIRSEGYFRNLAVCVPFLARNAILHAKIEGTSGKLKRTNTSIGSVTDPWSYRYWTHDFVWAWRGGVSGPQAAVPVYPKDGNPVWVVQENYSPGGCSDFADNGPWIPGLPADYTWLIHPERHKWQHSGGGGPPKFTPKSSVSSEGSKSEGDLSLSILDAPGKVHKDPAPTYFLYSPDDYVGVFYRDAVRNVAGTSEYANVSEADPEEPKQRKRFGYTALADHKSAHHFIGVINE